MRINEIKYIMNEILANKKPARNFPKTVNFPFEQLYIDLVTQIKTIEISSECTLFDSVQAVNENKDFSAPAYWDSNYTVEMIANFWIFGQNGQGDLWLFDNKGSVYFYDHNQGELSKAHFTDLELNFEKWIQFADLNKQLDEIFDATEQISEQSSVAYKDQLKQISNALLTRYPFEI